MHTEMAFGARNFGKIFYVFHAKEISCQKNLSIQNVSSQNFVLKVKFHAKISCRKFLHSAKILA